MKKNNIATLKKQIKNLIITDYNDLLQAKELTQLLFGEWVVAKRNYRVRIKTNRLSYSHAQFEAKIDIILGLMCLVNEKLVDYFL
jgi:hypothetical protein